MKVATCTLLDAAVRIGDDLCASAIWSSDGACCNWMGRSDPEVAMPFTATASSRSAELYAGTAGIALFLTELHALTGERRYADTAAAALRRSVRYLIRPKVTPPELSFFAGQLGVAWTAQRLAEIAPETGMEAMVEALLEQIEHPATQPRVRDVIAGPAGAVAPLIDLGVRTGRMSLLQLAIDAAHEVRKAAREHANGCYWIPDALEPDAPYPVTGFSHGASGFAVAMLEAWALDGDTRLRDAARAAFAFEDSLFSAPAANWLDTRSPYRSEGGVLHGVCRTTWCHGAPGIALARIRARQLDTARAAEHERMIGIAVGTTSKQLDELLAAPGADATLCHGISGLLEVLLRYALLTADANASRAVSESALRLAGMYDQVSEWPSGINAGGPNPSLMVGTAGIGYELLRIESPRSVRPVLLVEPASPG